MSPNRKAELQRKLSLAPIPKPPSGLADRIKSEIPKKLYIDTDLERRRLSQQVAFNMRVAAAILLLVGSSFLALHLLSRYHEDAKSAAPQAMTNARTRNEAVAPTMTFADAKPDGGQVFGYRSKPAPTDELAPPPPPPLKIADARAKQKDVERDEKKNDAPLSFSVSAPEIASAPAPAAPSPVSAPLAEKAEEGRVEAREPAPVPARAAANAQTKSGFLDLTKAAEAAEMKYAAPRSLFGLDLSTPLQHFATPSSLPRRGLRLDADAAPAPFDDAKEIVRISLDTAPLSGGKDATAVPLALDATLDITFDPEAVISHRALTGEMTPSERMIVEGTSSTALFEVELKPSLAKHAPIATARLHYRGTSDGKEQTIERVIHASDVAKSWNRASSRTKRASLAAALASGENRDAIAEKARAAGFGEIADEAKKKSDQ
jgi:hypothetical protein